MAYKDYKTPRGDRFSRLLWRIAGAERYILERGTFSDQVKWACMGGIVLSTGLMAAFAGGYAFYTIFQPKGSALVDETHLPTVALALVFGLIWGLVIFNIDRFIVAATGKGDGTEDITLSEWRSAIPRIIMGTIIAITISKPIEIRIFKSEIDLELYKHQVELKTEGYAQVDKEIDSKIADEKARIAKWEEEVAASAKVVADLLGQYVEEARIVTVGPRARAVKEEHDRKEAQHQTLVEQNQGNIKAAFERIAGMDAQKREEHAKVDQKVTKLDGLLERIKLAHKVAGPWISGFIMALFLAIELTPIFFKMMLVKGPYDYLEENLKEIVKARQGVQVDYGFFPDRQGKEKDKVTYHFADMERRMAEEQARQAGDLAVHALKRWGEREKGRIDEDPDNYVQSERGA